ncbi:MAG: hypothetical protein ABIT09_02655 [Croceibacterium sp.]
MIAGYPSPAGGKEYAVGFDRRRAHRVLVLPALFDEANKLRHFTIEVLRALDVVGIDGFLPDLPGCNESLAALEGQSLASWLLAAEAAAHHFGATAAVSIRGGALCLPPMLPVIRYAPVIGASVLRGLLRARVIASKESGRPESSERLASQGRRDGLELAGYHLGPQMIADLETAEPAGGASITEITQSDVGGPGLWLRVEPDHNPAQAARLASLIGAALA